MADLRSVAPVLPTADLDRAVGHYRALGFGVEPYEGGSYAFATRGDVHLHLSQVDGLDPATSMVSAYLYVEDAAALHAEWAAAGVAGRLLAPVATDYGLLEGAHVDPDGNLLRFGSPA